MIETFQRKILSDYFDGARETVVVVGKKNGKSSLFGAVALFHVLTTPRRVRHRRRVERPGREAAPSARATSGALRPSVAAPGDPAGRPRRDLGRRPVLASDSDTLDGQVPTLALVDELARHKPRRAMGSCETVSGPATAG